MTSDPVVLELVGDAIEEHDGVVDGGDFHIRICKSGTEQKHSKKTKTNNA